MSDITIREARAEDVPAIAALLREVLAEFGLRFGVGSPTDEQVLGLPGSYSVQGGCFWVALAPEGTLLGTAGIFPIEPGTFELRKMYLDARARGRGVGRALLRVVLERSASCGAHRVVLDTTEQMTRAIAFYEANGFVRDDTQVRGARCSRGYVRAITPADGPVRPPSAAE